MLSNVNLNLLRTLYILLEECHVSQAASRLHITQSAVSRQLAQLRELFADPLLIRDGNRLILTPKAEDLREKLEVLFEEFELLLKDRTFDPSLWEGEMVFASSDYVAQYIYPDIAELIGGESPKAKLQFRMWQPDYLDTLAQNGIHLVSTMLNKLPDGISGLSLGQDEPVCVMGESHPLADKDRLTVNDMLSFPHIVITGGGDKASDLDRELKALNMQRTIGIKVPFFSAAFSMICKTHHLLVLPYHIAANISRTLPITHKPLPFRLPENKYWLLWHPRYDSDPVHIWFRGKMLQILKSSHYSAGYDLKSYC